MLRQTSRKIGKTLTNKAEISETPLFNMILQNPTKLIIITCTYLYIVYTIYMVFWCLLTSPIFSLYQVGLTGLRGCVFHATCMCMVGTVLNASSNLHQTPTPALAVCKVCVSFPGFSDSWQFHDNSISFLGIKGRETAKNTCNMHVENASQTQASWLCRDCVMIMKRLTFSSRKYLMNVKIN